MMTMTELRQALEILDVYGGNDIGAEHDQLLLGDRNHHPRSMRPEHVATLERLGWTWIEKDACWLHFV